MSRELAKEGFRLQVFEGRDRNMGDAVLVVPTGAPGDVCYLVPSFAKAPEAVEYWFEDRGDRSLSRRVNEVREVAEARRGTGGIELIKKGVVS